MSARAIVSGVIHKAPDPKTAKSGSTYAALTLREKTGQATRWWKVFVFGDELRDEALRFSEGEPIAVAGEFDASIWAPEGREPRVNLSLTADAILSARKPKAKPADASPKPKATNGRDLARASWASPTPAAAGGIPFNDGVPFAPGRR
jgi:hypothetical protein